MEKSDSHSIDQKNLKMPGIKKNSKRLQDKFVSKEHRIV